MWLGRGFDTDNDGENDFVMWTQVAPVSGADMGKAIALVVTACLVIGVIFGLVVGGMAAVSWFSHNWAWFWSMVGWAIYGLVFLVTIGFVGLLVLVAASEKKR